MEVTHTGGATPQGGSAREIPLSQGYVALVDDEDYEWLCQFKWTASVSPHTVYAIRGVKRPDGGWTSERLHRAILKPPAGLIVDHINGNGLDNRRANLRLATGSQNSQRLPANGFLGVSWDKARGKWRADIAVNGKRMTLGRFDSKDIAARIRDAAAIELHGDFAVLNFPEVKQAS